MEKPRWLSGLQPLSEGGVTHCSIPNDIRKRSPTDDSIYKNHEGWAQPLGRVVGRGCRVGTVVTGTRAVEDV